MIDQSIWSTLVNCWKYERFRSLADNLACFIVHSNNRSSLKVWEEWDLCKVRPDLKKSVAKHFAKLKAKNIFPLLPSTAYILDRSQSVSISKLDADIYTRERGAKSQPWESRGKELEDRQRLTVFGMTELCRSFTHKQTKPAMLSSTWFPERWQTATGCERIVLIWL